MSILILPIGRVDQKVVQMLKDNLSNVFQRSVEIGQEMPEPLFAYNQERNQYLSTMILNFMAKEKQCFGYEKVLGIFDHDLYVPELNFVFGQATQSIAIISLTRLRQQFYRLPANQGLFYRRALTEAVHELGHTYGLSHCENPRCVMFFSNSLIDTDRKGPLFCPTCKNKLNKK